MHSFTRVVFAVASGSTSAAIGVVRVSEESLTEIPLTVAVGVYEADAAVSGLVAGEDGSWERLDASNVGVAWLIESGAVHVLDQDFSWVEGVVQTSAEGGRND